MSNLTAEEIRDSRLRNGSWTLHRCFTEDRCDKCGNCPAERAEVIVGPEPRPRLSVKLCDSCRAPLLAFVADVQQAVLANIR